MSAPVPPVYKPLLNEIMDVEPWNAAFKRLYDAIGGGSPPFVFDHGMEFEPGQIVYNIECAAYVLEMHSSERERPPA